MVVEVLRVWGWVFIELKVFMGLFHMDMNHTEYHRQW